jgi:carotenoid 1,2-hydratase
MSPLRPRFDVAVPQNGYRWWYIDAVSNDGEHGLTIIAFVGSVFSPYYALARRRGSADPENHCAINVALYSKKGKSWCMTERGRNVIERRENRFRVGPSSMSWSNNTLVVRIDEIAVPFPRRIRGEVRLTPLAQTGHTEVLDHEGKHFWHPLAPLAHLDARFEAPTLSWSGHGYHDMNWGDVPLEASFESWNWSRAQLSNGAFVTYDVKRRDQSPNSFALHFDMNGNARRLPSPAATDLGRSFWRMPRVMRSDGATNLLRALEDAPFYTRSLVSTVIGAEQVTAFHESLSLDRFRMPVVQAMLPFRMPRRSG